MYFPFLSEKITVTGSFEFMTFLISTSMVLGSAFGLYNNLYLDDANFVMSASIPPLGHAEATTNSIKRKPSKGNSWSSLEKGGPVFLKDVVFVAENSYLTLVLEDKTELHLGPNTLMVLDTQKNTQGGNFAVTEIKLLRGDIEVDQEKVAENSKSQPLELNVGEKVSIKLEKRSNLALKKQNDKASLVVKSGDVALSYQGKKEKKEFARASKDTLIEKIRLEDFEGDMVVEQKKVASSQVEGKKLASLLPQETGKQSIVDSVGSIKDVSKIPINLNLNSKKNKTVELDLNKDLKPAPAPVVAALTPAPVVNKEPVLFSDLKPDYSKSFNPLALTGRISKTPKSELILEFSNDPDFSKKLLRVDVTDDVKNDADFDFFLSPTYMMANGPFLKSMYKNPKIFWRVVDMSVSKDRAKKSGVIEFQFNEKPKIETAPPKFDGASTLAFQWVLKESLPGKYSIEVAEDAGFKKIVCSKSVTRFGKSKKGKGDSKDNRSIDLEFAEATTIDTADCKTRLSPKKTYYTRITTFDPAGTKLTYSVPDSGNSVVKPQ
jgi:hypothetical protein